MWCVLAIFFRIPGRNEKSGNVQSVLLLHAFWGISVIIKARVAVLANLGYFFERNS